MKKYIAYCTDERRFLKDQLLSHEYAKQFPGCLVIYYFNQLISHANFEIHSGDVILNMVKSGQINIKNIFIMQDMNSRLGLKLTKLGAIKFHISCYESPLYAPKFYKNKIRYINGYRFTSCYPSSFQNLNESAPNYFPSYDQIDLINCVVSKKEKIVLIASNKFLPYRFDFIKLWRPKTWLRFLFDKYLILTNVEYRHAISNSLNFKRLELIVFFSKKDVLDIYGNGWDDPSILPNKFKKYFQKNKVINYLGPCKSKLETMRQYKFSLIVENVSWPHYITEKIIDAFVAKTIPIYLGAPDISQLIPNDSYIDIRDFNDLESLWLHIANLDEVTKSHIINAGQRFLQEQNSEKFSFQGKANELFNELFLLDNEFSK